MHPCAGVDPISRRNFWNMIYEMARAGTTVFVTTHYMDEADYCDRLALIYRGELVAVGTPADLKRTAMKDGVYRVACADPRDAMERAQGLPGVRDAALFGDDLHLVVGETDGGESVLRQRLAEMGATAVEQVTPSLEEVFVSLIEAKDRESGTLDEVRRHGMHYILQP